MSLQVQPQPQPFQQQQQQPIQQVYPTSVTYQSPDSPTHHSNGSFGSVFVVLAIIIVISAVACCLGRLCNRRSSHSHNQKQIKQQQKPQKNHKFPPKEVDIEFGFDKRIAASKPNAHGGVGTGRGGMRPFPHGDMKTFEMKPLGRGDMKTFEMKLGHPHGNLRAGP